MSCVLCAWPAAGQTSLDLKSQGRVWTGTTLPAQCSVGQIFFKTDAPSGANLYACTTPNEWAAVGMPALGGDASGTQSSVTVKGLQGRPVSPAAPGDQSVLRWNSATGQWEPATAPLVGSGGPPASCAQGGLYLQSDIAKDIQQLYVCSKANTWTMASTRSGAAVNRPSNCVAGQTWLATDTGSMTYCSSPGNPGVWSAIVGQQGPAGPPGANGNTILSGAGAPASGIGSDGDFYLNTTADCLYGPKTAGGWGNCTVLTGGVPGGAPLQYQFNNNGMFGGSGLYWSASTGTTYNAPNDAGSRFKLTEPDALHSDSGRAGVFHDIRISGLKSPDNYANSIGHEFALNIYNGRNSSDNSDKKTQSGLNQSIIFGGSGQRAGQNTNVWCAGVGDCMGINSIVTTSAFNTAGGDEGTLGASFRVFEAAQELKTAINSSTKSSCAATQLTGPITKSTNSTDAKTVTVDSVVNCNAGDWLTIEGESPVDPFSNNAEVVKLTAVGAGTITAIFQAGHSSGASVKPSNMLVLASMESVNAYDNRLGQDRFVTVGCKSGCTNDVSYSTGSVASITNSGDGIHYTVVGAGTAWTTSMVGGDSYSAGCISLDIDDTAYQTAWYPIQTVADGTHMTILKYTGQAATGTYAYTILPCARIGALDVNTTSTDMAISSVVLYANNFSWPAGKTFYQTAAPWIRIQHNVLSYVNLVGPSLGIGAMFRAVNGNLAGLAPASAGLMLEGNGAGYVMGIDMPATFKEYAINIGGPTAQGALHLNTTATDNKQIQWEASSAGGGYANMYPEPSAGGFTLNSQKSAKLNLKATDIVAGSVTLDYSAMTQGRTFTFPDVNGQLATANPGLLTRTLPAVGSAVDIGKLAGGVGTVQIQACLSYTNCKAWIASIAYSGDGVWRTVAPISTDNQGSDDYELDIRSASDVEFRLLRLAGSGTPAVTIYMNWTGYNGGSFVPSSATSAATIPASYWGGAVLSQSAGLVNIAGAVQGASAAPSVNNAACPGAAIGAGATNMAGAITGLPAGACTVTLTFASAMAAHGWSCSVSNQTHPGAANMFQQSASTRTTVSFTGTSASGDVLAYGPCAGF